jgi:hypothetical protein
VIESCETDDGVDVLSLSAHAVVDVSFEALTDYETTPKVDH